MKHYETLAALTKSDQFHGDLISRTDFVNTVGSAVVALNVLDAVKKSLFYGRSFPGTGLNVRRNVNDIASGWHVTQGSHTLKFQIFSEQKAIDVIHSILGVATEAGELLELLLKTIQTKQFDTTNFCEEIGDCQWYFAVGCNAVGSNFDIEQRRNINKLMGPNGRYKDKFDAFLANNRNLNIERDVLEQLPIEHVTLTQKQLERALNVHSVDATMGMPDFELAERLVQTAVNRFTENGETIGGESVVAG